MDFKESRDIKKIRILFVGAFPKRKPKVKGGNITDCLILKETSFFRDFEVFTVDTTQISQPPPNIFVRLIFVIKRFFIFLKYLLFSKIEIVICFSSAGFSFLEKSLYLALAKLLRKRTIISIRSGIFMDQCRKRSLFKRISIFLLKPIDIILCQERKWKDFYTNFLNIPEEKCIVIRNWTAAEDFFDVPIKLYKDEKKVQLIYIGWLEKYKGINILVETFTEIIKKYPNVELIIVGGGSEYENIKNFIRQKKIEDKIILTGWVSFDKKNEVLKKADIFVLPSYTEGFPNALVEAMAMGKAVVVTPVGGIPDVIKNKENGILVPVGNKEKLAQALIYLIKNPEERYRLGLNARAIAKKLFTPEEGAKKLKKIIYNLLNIK